MKSFRIYCRVYAAMAIVAVSILSCSRMETVEPQEETRKVYTAELVFGGTLTTFDAATRASSSSWEDASIVYLQFAVGEDLVQGKAIYDASLSQWYLEYYDEITSGEELICQAYYFENPVEITYSDVVLDKTSVVYRDDRGSYYYDGTTLTVNAHLSPITGRIRFEGEPGAEYTLSGPGSYTSYNFETNELQTEFKMYAGTLSESGSSPYFHMFFSELQPREISIVDNDANILFVRKCGDNVLANGKSGYLTIPTVANHNGWSTNEFIRTYTVGDVTFNMIIVQNGSFRMGSNSGYDDEKPVHNVTITHNYYMGETEVTQALWAEVMGTTYSEDMGDFPVRSVTWNGCSQFVEKLNKLTGGAFAMPTEAEWEFAARGGRLSSGYWYSGSNTLDDVGWYNSNSGSAQKVKQKKPNELGLYDMSGNVSEWCKDWYARYSEDDAVDPTGPTSGSYWVYRGGNYNNAASYCTCTYRNHGSPSNSGNYLGFRLASY